MLYAIKTEEMDETAEMPIEQSKRMVQVDFLEAGALRQVLGAVMKRLPQVRLEQFPPGEKGSQLTIVITVSGQPEELGFFLDEAEETLQDELDSLGLKIAVHANSDDWGTE